MSSGFTSGGSLENPIERDDQWLKAQKELDEERARKAEIQQQHGGKSLYEILQSNKAAKQEQFEESIKLKNQFRALEDDEVDFLESVLEKERAKEDAIKKDTEEQLKQFAEARSKEEAAASVQEPDTYNPAEPQDWSVKLKRKRLEKAPFRGIKSSKTSIDQQISPITNLDTRNIKSINSVNQDTEDIASPKHTAPTGNKANSSESPLPSTVVQSKGVGLVAYDSDDDSS